MNRRLCPDVYLGVVAISKNADGYAFGEGEEIVEYAVKMRKLAEQGFLHKMLERDAVTLGDLDRIAEALRRFYEAQHPTKEIESWGGYRSPENQYQREFSADRRVRRSNAVTRRV